MLPRELTYKRESSPQMYNRQRKSSSQRNFPNFSALKELVEDLYCQTYKILLICPYNKVEISSSFPVSYLVYLGILISAIITKICIFLQDHLLLFEFFLQRCLPVVISDILSLSMISLYPSSRNYQETRKANIDRQEHSLCDQGYCT